MDGVLADGALPQRRGGVRGNGVLPRRETNRPMIRGAVVSGGFRRNPVGRGGNFPLPVDGLVYGEAKGQSLLIQVRQAKLGRTNSGRSYIVKKSTYD